MNVGFGVSELVVHGLQSRPAAFAPLATTSLV